MNAATRSIYLWRHVTGDKKKGLMRSRTGDVATGNRTLNPNRPVIPADWRPWLRTARENLSETIRSNWWIIHSKSDKLVNPMVSDRIIISGYISVYWIECWELVFFLFSNLYRAGLTLLRYSRQFEYSTGFIHYLWT